MEVNACDLSGCRTISVPVREPPKDAWHVCMYVFCFCVCVCK